MYLTRTNAIIYILYNHVYNIVFIFPYVLFVFLLY